MPGGQLGFWLVMFVLSPLGPISTLGLSGKSRKNNMDLKPVTEERKCGGEESLGAGGHLCVFSHWQCKPRGSEPPASRGSPPPHGELEMTGETGFG